LATFFRADFSALPAFAFPLPFALSGINVLLNWCPLPSFDRSFRTNPPSPVATAESPEMLKRLLLFVFQVVSAD
jgi:hypothetical protein